jgi:hypothetical protein
MRPTDAKDALKLAISLQQPVFLEGSPGVGKSDIVRQAALETLGNIEDVRVSLLDAVDARGLMFLEQGKTVWAPPVWLPQDGSGVLFLDELTSGAQMVQAALYQLILDRRLGEYRLPNGWAIVAAGNKDSDRAIVQRMSTALANRFLHLSLDVHPHDWVTWAQNNGLSGEVIFCIKNRPELLYTFDPRTTEKPFASPRTWAMLDRIFQTTPAPALEFPLYAGLVGQAPAAEFTGFLRILREMVDPDAVLASPDTSEIPGDPSIMYALSLALARKASPDNLPAYFRYIERIPPEFGMLSVHEAMRRDKGLQTTPCQSFVKWASKNSDFYL